MNFLLVLNQSIPRFCAKFVYIQTCFDFSPELAIAHLASVTTTWLRLSISMPIEGRYLTFIHASLRFQALLFVVE